MNPNNKSIRDIPGLAPPAPTARRLLYLNDGESFWWFAHMWWELVIPSSRKLWGGDRKEEQILFVAVGFLHWYILAWDVDILWFSLYVNHVRFVPANFYFFWVLCVNFGDCCNTWKKYYIHEIYWETVLYTFLSESHWQGHDYERMFIVIMTCKSCHLTKSISIGIVNQHVSMN